MAFLLCLLDTVLLVLHLMNTLGLVHQLRKTKSCKDVDFRNVCLTWIIYFALHPFTKCPCQGFFAGLFKLISILGKAYVVIPLFKGTNKLYEIFIEKGKAKQLYEKVKTTVENLVAPKPSGGEKPTEETTTTPSG